MTFRQKTKIYRLCLSQLRECKKATGPSMFAVPTQYPKSHTNSRCQLHQKKLSDNPKRLTNAITPLRKQNNFISDESTFYLFGTVCKHNCRIEKHSSYVTQKFNMSDTYFFLYQLVYNTCIFPFFSLLHCFH